MIDRNFILNLAHEDTDTSEYILSLYNVPKMMGAKTIVEIGAGRSTFALVAAANETKGQVMSIDIGGWDTLNRVTGGQLIMEDEKRFTMITGNSLEEPRILFSVIDFLFWDSEHTYDLSVKEIAKWFPEVRKGGIIMAHDMCHESKDKQGARQALDEFLASKEGKNYHAIFLLDTKIIGMAVIYKL